MAARLGVRGQFFSTPTSLQFGFGEGDAQRTHLERVEPSPLDLGKLAELHRLIERVAVGEMTPAQAAPLVDWIARARPRYGTRLTVAALALSSAASAVFLGGGVRETAAAAGIGLTTGLVAWRLGRFERGNLLFEPLAAALAALVALGCAALMQPLSIYVATLAGIIFLIPGFSLTLAMSELASRHLSSGTARFAGAITVFLTITFGVAVGSQIGGALFTVAAGAVPALPPPWAEPLALVAAPLALTVLFRAPLVEYPWILGVGVAGLQVARIGSDLVSPELGMFAGALAIGLASRLYAKLRRMPEVVTLVPAILLLVPGSIGYRSLSSLMQSEVMLGIETAFRMIVIAVSLVAGLLLASVAAPAWAPARRRSS
jgi:uncharacterized membrane protein YjjP (DUF1212 family)